MSDFNFNNYNPRNLIANLNLEKVLNFVRGNKEKMILSALVGLVVLTSFYYIYFASPQEFPTGVVVEIEKGETLKSIAFDLNEKKVIRSPLLFEIFVRVMASDRGAMSGDYYFETPRNVYTIARKITKGEFGLTPIRITLREGLTVKEMAGILSKKFTEFDPDEFIRVADEEKKEGYLFPDTYYFLPNIEAKDVIRAMEKNFYEKISSIQEEISLSDKNLHEIITMASILEEEAKTFESKKIIAGILWKRIKIGMPLQVDAVFPYIIGKNTYQLSLEDLKVESPYNTYINKGLPPGPIAGPGIYSIRAALEPIESDYLYYLSDRSGNMYYAVDFDEHRRNKALYMN